MIFSFNVTSSFQNVFVQASSESPISAFNCEELNSHVQNLKESTRSKKDKFCCILNILKSALSEELGNPEFQETIKDVLENKVTDDSNKVILEKENQSEKTCLENELVVKTTEDQRKDCISNTNNLEVPSMVPIFKPRPVMRNKFNPAHPRSIPVTSTIQANPNPNHNNPKFTIPCQKAADVLDMSKVSLPIEVTKNSYYEQPKLEPNTLPQSSISANQAPTTVFVHSADLDEPVSIMFKPKAISLFQLYGNLLKKITITVLVPYHMSKMGQQ